MTSNIGIFSNLFSARKAHSDASKVRKELEAQRQAQIIAKHKSLISEIEACVAAGDRFCETNIPRSEWNIIARCLKAKGYKVCETPSYIRSRKAKEKYLADQKTNMKKTNCYDKEMFINW